MSATGYLPRRWPAKYCHCYESLRPCSGWERVVSSRLVTDEFCFHSPLHAYAFLHLSLVSLSLNYLRRFRCICRLRFWLRFTYSKYRMCIQSCIMIINFAIILTLFGSACAIFDCFVSFAFATLTTAVFLNIRYTTSSSCSCKPTTLLRFVNLPFRKSPRPISISRLKMLPLLHLWPINRIICPGTY